MKILIVRPHASILTTTSYNMQELGLAKAYVRAGHQADIVLYGGKEVDHTVEVNTEDGDAITLYYLKGFGIAKNAFFYSIRKIADSYDLIQVNEYDQITSWLYYTNKKYRDKVIVYHGPYYSDFNRGYNLRCKVFDNIFLKIRNNYEVPCFTKSNASAEFLKGKGFKNVIPVGVGLDADVWESGETKIEGALEGASQVNERDDEKDIFTFIYIGKLEPRRNTLFLLDVVDRLLTSRDDIRFLLIGDGEEGYKAQCLNKAKKWIDSGRIAYISKVSQTELPIYYSMADCMLFPSIYEIFGMVLMEAIYFGVPVITSNNGGADMLFHDGENGIVIDCNSKGADGDLVAHDFSIDEWAYAAEKMYANDELRDKIKQQLILDRDMLSWDAVAEKILNKINE